MQTYNIAVLWMIKTDYQLEARLISGAEVRLHFFVWAERGMWTILCGIQACIM